MQGMGKAGENGAAVKGMQGEEHHDGPVMEEGDDDSTKEAEQIVAESDLVSDAQVQDLTQELSFVKNADPAAFAQTFKESLMLAALIGDKASDMSKEDFVQTMKDLQNWAESNSSDPSKYAKSSDEPEIVSGMSEEDKSLLQSVLLAMQNNHFDGNAGNGSLHELGVNSESAMAKKGGGITEGAGDTFGIFQLNHSGNWGEGGPFADPAGKQDPDKSYNHAVGGMKYLTEFLGGNTGETSDTEGTSSVGTTEGTQDGSVSVEEDSGDDEVGGGHNHP